MSSAARQTRRVHLDGCDQAAVGLGFAAFGAELPELEARCHERLTYARPTVLAATEDPQGTRVLNLFARDWTCLLYTSPSPRDLSTSRMPSSA